MYVLQQAISCLGIAARERENSPYLAQEGALRHCVDFISGTIVCRRYQIALEF